ncbi:MAG: hypothetical protein K2X11_10290, partial [Acetobacteraceae bacterium]|nr:hypothetical protein [Acetobacteraceae bacterium]
MAATRILAELVAAPPAIPPAIRHEAVRSFVNWLGCAVAGAPHPGVDGATACARQDGPHGWQGAGQPQGPGDGQRIGQSAGSDTGRHGGGGALPDGAVLPADVQALDNATYNALCDAVQHL